MLGKICKRIQKLDTRDDESELDEQGCEERRFLLAEQNIIFFNQEAILHQKARQKWVTQGCWLY